MKQWTCTLTINGHYVTKMKISGTPMEVYTTTCGVFLPKKPNLTLSKLLDPTTGWYEIQGQGEPVKATLRMPKAIPSIEGHSRRIDSICVMNKLQGKKKKRKEQPMRFCSHGLECFTLLFHLANSDSFFKSQLQCHLPEKPSCLPQQDPCLLFALEWHLVRISSLALTVL